MSQVNIMSQEKKMSDKLGQDCIFLLLESKRPGEETEFIHIIIKHKKKKISSKFPCSSRDFPQKQSLPDRETAINGNLPRYWRVYWLFGPVP